MDDDTLGSLETALGATPENTKLLHVVVEGLLARGKSEQARAHLARCTTLRESSVDTRAIAARVLCQTGELDQALELCHGDAPETLIVKADVLHRLGRDSEAIAAYRSAVEGNSTLENPELLARIQARTPKAAQRAGAALKVVANDDTAALEATRWLQPERDRVTFADVGGLEQVKEQIRKRIILPFSKPSLFQRFKKRVGGGILLYGPPGCGKTLLARSTAGECNAAFFNIAISDVLDMYIGESERKLNALFEKARSSAPAVMFFDELEALAGKRQYSREATSAKLVSQFLSEMDGFTQNNHGVLIVGATNVPWAVDPAFRRPGRFDRVLFVPPPDQVARQSILERLVSARPHEECDLSAIAKRTSGFSGADLEHVVELATDEAIDASLSDGREVPIRQEHLLRALEQARATTLEWLTTARNYARYANEGGQYDEVLDFLKKHGKGA
ncbi:MAG TPA: ATP-binding protein [Polyangiaceae bacterium]|nr:ATP-binding protein [Polyangiaceae bacterium]